MLSQEDVRMSAKQFGPREKGTGNTRNGGQRLPVKYYISVPAEEKETALGQVNERAIKKEAVIYPTGLER